ncbi:MAG: DUF4388 domain-containing protein [Clostridia bacterium]|nr:DUF4388 domain-containing protein [Deltaproteobacteria bacterium]
MALRGTLKDFGVADIFQLIGHQGKTGFLIIRERGRETSIGFRDGSVVSASSSTRKERDMLGGLLVRAEVITNEQLGQALDIQKRRGGRLGEILVDAGAVTPQSMQQFVRLQMNDSLYPLFLWSNGTYEFNQTPVDLPQDIEPLRSEGVLMEGFRQVDEGPGIRKAIPGYGITFKRVEDLEKLDAGESGSGEEELDFDDAFAEFESGTSSHRTNRLKNIGQNERIVYQLAVPGRDVQKIIDLSRLGEFETCKALTTLIDAGIVDTQAPAKAEVQKKSAPSNAPLGGGSRRRVGGVGSLVGKAFGVLAAVALVVFLSQRTYGWHLRGWAPLRKPTGFVTQDVQAALSTTQLQKIERALAIYRAEAGDYPRELTNLVDVGLLKRTDLAFPWRKPYYYARRQGGYELLRPLY